MSALYPDVPVAEGVPPVFRAPTAMAAPLDLPLIADDVGGATGGLVTWGIYKTNGGPSALNFDSMVAVEPRQEFRISDYPIEAGGFESYNKVATPAELRVTVTRGGSDGSRDNFLTRIDAMIASTDLFDVVTPDSAFRGYSLVSKDYRRTAEAGATLLSVELNFEEIRQTAASAFTAANAHANTNGDPPKSPSGANPVSAGPVQPVTPTATQTPRSKP